MGIFDKNSIITRVVIGDDTITDDDFLLILDSDELDGEFDLQLPAGKNDFYLKFGHTQASVDNNVVWTLVPAGADLVDAAVGTLGAGSKAIVFRNGTWYLAI